MLLTSIRIAPLVPDDAVYGDVMTVLLLASSARGDLFTMAKYCGQPFIIEHSARLHG